MLIFYIVIKKSLNFDLWLIFLYIYLFRDIKVVFNIEF